MRTDWLEFDEAHPDEYVAVASLLILQEESNPQKIDEKLRGAIKGTLVKHLSVEDGRYFLDTIWGITSTTQLSQTRGTVMAAWLRSPTREGGTNADKLEHIVTTLRSFDAAKGDPTVQAALEMGATARVLPPEPEAPPADEPTTQQEESVSEPQETASLMDVLKDLAKTSTDKAEMDGLPEAPASVNFTVMINGFSAQWTLRDWGEMDLLKRVDGLTTGLKKLGAYPTDRYGNAIQTINNANMPAATSTTTQTAPPRAARPPAAAAPQVDGLMPGEQAMRIATIEVSTTSTGNPALKLYAPNHQYADLFYNFGIDSFFATCPEMRGDGAGQFTENDLMPSVEDGKVTMPSYTGSWVAVWVESEKVNSKGNPYKNVTRMYPAG